MSLDVYLYEKTGAGKLCDCEDWCGCDRDDALFEANVTHNLTKMASKAGLYKPCWHPEELGIERAEELIPWLLDGLKRLRSDEEGYRWYDSDNGWGDYNWLCEFVERYLLACIKYQDAYVHTGV